jgi:hypothetical protein
VRVSAAVEKAGFPTASIVISGFMPQGKAVAQNQGIEDLGIAEYPGVIMTDSKEGLRQKVETVLVDNIVRELTSTTKGGAAGQAEPAPRDIVFKGDLNQVNEFFYRNLWSDGLPIIPPTLKQVERFLKYTDRSPEEVIGVLPPEYRQATVWNIAVNGVMAGCRPEYMPILVSLVEIIAEPQFDLRDAGTTPGWEPLIVLNGPIIKELDFNYGQGVMRVGRQANTSIGRFLRLYLRNVPGFRIPPGVTDKGSIGQSFHVVLAENEDAVAEMGWQPFSVDRGFSAGDNVVTVTSCIFVSAPTYSSGSTALEHMETIAEIIGRRTMGIWGVYVPLATMFKPLLMLAPGVAKAIADDGWTKKDIREYFYKNVRERAAVIQKHTKDFNGKPDMDIYALAASGWVPKEYGESPDPQRLIPVIPDPESLLIVVSGDPARNQNKAYIQSGHIGPPTSRKVVLPKNWQKLLSEGA